MHAQLIRRATARTIAASNSTLYRSFADEAVVGLTGRMKLNFNLPQLTLYDSADVFSVVAPGAMGEFEVTANHVPIVAELKAGLLTIKHGEGIDERYFIPGGFSLTHAGSVTDIVCPEAVKIDDLDLTAVSANFESAKTKLANAQPGSAAAAEFMIEVEVNRAMGYALGISLA